MRKKISRFNCLQQFYFNSTYNFTDTTRRKKNLQEDLDVTDLFQIPLVLNYMLIGKWSLDCCNLNNLIIFYILG
ncbi:hypothetical protein BpHYR1_040047 [Brachionus plicatilis]|uniref:Uncharacterized protein n=1 Tax=Brachionus plicatilis TaxID=10195 RepID=A0A3M7P701_BRAPC|nr:hypothetical protein BpHYR1_040047 [Brachionus plicatilis]